MTQACVPAACQARPGRRLQLLQHHLAHVAAASLAAAGLHDVAQVPYANYKGLQAKPQRACRKPGQQRRHGAGAAAAPAHSSNTLHSLAEGSTVSQYSSRAASSGSALAKAFSSCCSTTSPICRQPTWEQPGCMMSPVR